MDAAMRVSTRLRTDQKIFVHASPETHKTEQQSRARLRLLMRAALFRLWPLTTQSSQELCRECFLLIESGINRG
jgi:hypothetical protein